MIKRAEEMLACYFWIRLEGIVALWYLKVTMNLSIGLLT